MSNREKYRFDYFTIDNYENIVRLAKEQGFTFITHADGYIEDRKEVIWRHDVEFSPDIALKFAQIENKYGVKAIYFFQIHSEFYNIFEKYMTRILYQIKNLGHEIGLHFDAHYYGIGSEAELNEYIRLDKKYFERVFGLKIRIFSFHNTTPFILSCENYKYGDLINVYSSYFKTRYKYCADSTGYWRYEILDEVLKDQNIRHLQVLTHDAMWSEDILSPRKRVRKSIQCNADRIKDQYDKILTDFEANNIDD